MNEERSATERTPRPSRLYRMIEDRIEGTLIEYIERERTTKTWREMAADLEQRTGILITFQTLHNWFADRITVEVKVTDSASTS